MKRSSVSEKASFQAVRSQLFRLPVSQRLRLAKEVEEHDWAERFWEASDAIGRKLKAKGMKASDVPKLIEDVRKRRGKA